MLGNEKLGRLYLGEMRPTNLASRIGVIWYLNCNLQDQYGCSSWHPWLLLTAYGAQYSCRCSYVSEIMSRYQGWLEPREMACLLAKGLG